MNGCMVAHATVEEQDRAREEWFAGRDERRAKRDAERVEIEKRRKEVLDMIEKDKERERREGKGGG